MSKAFTREDDAAENTPLRPLPTLPPGVKNYITASGAEALRAELAKLENQRSSIATQDRSQTSSLDQRIARLEQILSSLTVVEPTPADEVRFGASVAVKYPSGDVETFKIVGINEIDLDRNYISWQSPLAKALMNAKVGDSVRFRAPAGEQRLEILSIEFR
jgi:transcription elongation factor GreB